MISYEGLNLYNPPWVLTLLWPSTIWCFHLSWVLAVFATLITVAVSIPNELDRSWKSIGLLLLIFSFPNLRNLVDTNLEWMVIAGALLLIWAASKRSVLGLAFALVLVSSKAHETWLLVSAVGIFVIQHWPRRDQLVSAGLPLRFIAPFAAWKGAEWPAALNKFPGNAYFLDAYHNVSLRASLSKFGFPEQLIQVVWIMAFGVIVVLLWKLKRMPT